MNPDEATSPGAGPPAAGERTEQPPAPVAGERAIPSVARERSVRARVGNALALAAMAGLGVAFLAWYYTAQFARDREARDAAQRASDARTAAEMAVPGLGRVDPPVPAAPAPAPVVSVMSATNVLGPAPPLPPQAAAPAAWPPAAPAAAAPPAKTPAQLALERMLGEPVVKGASVGAAASAMPVTADSAPPPGIEPPEASGWRLPATLPVGAPAREAPARAGLAGLLVPTATPAVAAQVLPTQRYLLPKGAFVDCTLETAIDSTWDGLVTCVGATDVWSADGKTVLLPRGTKFVGEKRGDVRQGQARVFVLWTEARTPAGIVARLDSPGTDALGRTGLPGQVDTHFWERFGAAILISVIDGSLQALVASQRRGSGTTVQLSPFGTRDVIAEVLRGTISVPPTVMLAQGARVQVLVARDVDFRPVQGLRDAAPR